MRRRDGRLFGVSILRRRARRVGSRDGGRDDPRGRASASRPPAADRRAPASRSCGSAHRPLVAHAALASLRFAGVAPLVVNTHHLAGAFAAEVAALGLVAVHEPAILGHRAGGVAERGRGARRGRNRAVERATSPRRLDVAALLAAHAVLRALATLAVARARRGKGRSASTRAAASRGCGVSASATRRPAEITSARWSSAPSSARCCRGKGASSATRVLPALRRGGLVSTFTHQRGRGRSSARSPRTSPRTSPGSPHRGASSFVGPGARVAPGVVLAESIAGARATVEGEGALERVIVWPGARAIAPLADAVVTPARVVAVPRETRRPRRPNACKVRACTSR